MYTRFVFVLLLGFALACRPDKETVLPETGSAPAGCTQSGAVIHRVSDINGTVGYHRDSTRLTLSYGVPGTFDSQWKGVVCNLPNEYRVVGKRVTFSGEFRDAKGTLRSMLGGQEMYYLYLTDIKSQ
ncbi:MAG: hypothetical protein H7Z72_06245 [Bacteroidetes bacterium]|nr:hypothetical protein [Fibrella sp.]